MVLFNRILKYTNKIEDQLAIFDGNVLISAIENPDENNVKTMIGFRRVDKPQGKKIGDSDDSQFKDIQGYAFHFQRIESVQVMIYALEEVKESMINAR